ncbi:MAG: hypothetical protein BWZ10_00454 [candidate division BRC1 bacterium ADurb.BinA364]|nr:MAG: hypothetical protein BWZ10_00454 [candidate division BRC1 bacterium ADurb.BinA364]
MNRAYLAASVAFLLFSAGAEGQGVPQLPLMPPLPAAAGDRESGGVFRAFKKTSYWNTPMPADAPIDAQSAEYIAWLKENTPGWLQIGSGKWAMPRFVAEASDPLATFTARNGVEVTFHCPANMKPMEGNDAALVVLDRHTGQDIAFFEFRGYDGIHPVATNCSRHMLDSNGLDASLGDDPRNFGHRGIPGSIAFVRADELAAGVIAHRLKIALPGTADFHVFPMVGHEKNRGGIIGEGMVLRIKPGVDLSNLSGDARTIAIACQTYGVVVGDNSGNGAKLKAESGLNLDNNMLQSISWDSWEFVERGFVP